MSTMFKKVAVVAIAVLTMSGAANAQEKGDMAVGGNLVSGLLNEWGGSDDGFFNFGVGAKYQYNFSNPFRVEGSFNYYLKSDHIKMWDVSLTGHWLYKFDDRYKTVWYPLLGVGLLNSGHDYLADLDKWNSINGSKITFVGGFGFEYPLTENLIFNTETKYQYSANYNRWIYSAGLNYKF